MSRAEEVQAVAGVARKVARSPLAPMIGLSLLAHAILAAAISIEQPVTTPRFPDDAKIALVTPKNSAPEIIEWILSNDPANVFAPGRGEPSVMRLEYSPSFDAGVPAILAAEPPSAEIAIPDLIKPGEGIGVRRGVWAPRRNPPAVVATGPVGSADGSCLTKMPSPLDASELASVSGAGLFLHVREPGMPGPIILPARGSGSRRLDALGGEILKRDAAGTTGLRRVTIERGGEGGK